MAINFLLVFFNLLILNEYFGAAQTFDDEAVRQLSTGSLLKGKTIATNNGTIYAFLGIPYAEAPIGAMRYHGPVTYGKWPGVLDASYYKVACVFYSTNQEIMAKIPLMSEDCLQLNVFTSKTCTMNSQCPVMVYIDSGLYNYGSSITLKPEGMANLWATDGIVVVTLNFRIGSFGFLNALDEKAAIKNAGLQDQIECLKWIQREITRFGGNPKQVTLVGIGLGAINVDQLALSPSTNGLYHQLALLGGSASMIPKINEFANYLSTVKLAETLHCNVSSPDANGTPDMVDVVGCLRTKSANDLMQGQQEIEAESLTYNFKLLALDGDQKASVLPATVTSLVQYRKGCNMLIGNLEDDLEWLTQTLHYERSVSVKSLCEILLKFREIPVNENSLRSCNREYEGQGKRLLNDVAVYLPTYETAYYNSKNGGNTYLFEVPASEQDANEIFSASIDVMPDNIIYNSLQSFIKRGSPTTDAFDWQKYLIERNNFASISTMSPSITKENYHMSAISFWILGGVNRTQGGQTIKPPVPTEETGVGELKSIVAQLFENMMEVSQALESGSSALKQQWISKMHNISKQLNSTIDELLEAQKSEDYQEFMKNYTSLSNNCAPQQLSESAKHEADHNEIWPKNDQNNLERSAPRINVEQDDTTVSIRLNIPAAVLEPMRQVSQLLEEAFETLEDGYGGSITIDVSKSAPPSNSIKPIVKQSILQGLFASTISEGEFVQPTLPTVTIQANSSSDTWFSWPHIVAMIVFIILVIAVLVLCVKTNKRKHYENIS